MNVVYTYLFVWVIISIILAFYFNNFRGFFFIYTTREL